MAKNRNAKHTADAGLVKESAAHKPLGRYNFMGMAFAGILIVTGFLLMLGAVPQRKHLIPIFSARAALWSARP